MRTFYMYSYQVVEDFAKGLATYGTCLSGKSFVLLLTFTYGRICKINPRPSA